MIVYGIFLHGYVFVKWIDNKPVFQYFSSWFDLLLWLI